MRHTPFIARFMLFAVCLASIARVTPARAAEVVLQTFSGGNDGGDPGAGVILDSAGNIYGTTYYGGTNCYCGIVYKLDSSGHETVLYSFKGGSDGANPYARVIRDGAGNIYGTTTNGGAWSAGVVYMLDPSGNESVLHSFKGGSDGANPYADVVRDAAGNLYGTTYNGGTSGEGVVYKVDTSGNETILHSFAGGADGANPYGGLTRNSAGDLYGTTVGGGLGHGVVFKVDQHGSETVLYRFTGGADGGYPCRGLVLDRRGNLYGAATGGGTSNGGVVFKLDKHGHETVLHSFTGGAAGSTPYASVIRDFTGNLYGTTYNGGTSGAGVVYKLDPSGNETVLYSFEGGSNGYGPVTRVVRDTMGNLYGTAHSGSVQNGGIIFKLTP
jgi:uncharacterized repeat protein (TIGR03803 family)